MIFSIRRHMFGIQAWTITVQTTGVTVEEDINNPRELKLFRDQVFELLDDLDSHLSTFPEVEE